MVLSTAGSKSSWFLPENYLCQCRSYLKGWRELTAGRTCLNLLALSFGSLIERRLSAPGITRARRYQSLFLYSDRALVMR